MILIHSTPVRAGNFSFGGSRSKGHVLGFRGLGVELRLVASALVWSATIPAYSPQTLNSKHSSKVGVRLPGKGNSNFHGATPVHSMISMIQWIRTGRLSIKNSLYAGDEDFGPRRPHKIPENQEQRLQARPPPLVLHYVPPSLSLRLDLRDP